MVFRLKDFSYQNRIVKVWKFINYTKIMLIRLRHLMVLPVYPFTTAIGDRVTRISTRSVCCAITRFIFLYAEGASSRSFLVRIECIMPILSSLRTSSPRSRLLIAWFLPMIRQAPWEQLSKLSGFPLPTVIKLFVPCEPGIIPLSPFEAFVAPFL